MKNKYKLIIVILIILAGALLVDWKDFKAGILGQPPVTELDNKE